MTRRMPRQATTTMTMALSTRTPGRASADAVAYVDNITAALAQADPANAADSTKTGQLMSPRSRRSTAEIREIVAGLPDRRRIVVTSHDAFQYFGREYGLTFIAPQGLSTESEASAKDVARLIQQIRERGIRAVFIENISRSAPPEAHRGTRPGPPSAARSIPARCPARTVRRRPIST